MNLGERIKQCRKSRGLTQDKLSELLNISVMSVRRWEWGERKPDISIIPKLASVLNTSVEYLMGINETNMASNAQDTNETIEHMLQKAKTRDFKNLVLGETNDMLIYNDGEQIIRLKNTPENKILFRRAIHEMLDNILQKTMEEEEHVNGKKQNNNIENSHVDIKQQDIGGDAIVALPQITNA